MEISVVDPTKLMAQIKEQAKLAKKGIKEIIALTVKGHFQVQSGRGPETQELSELSDKWTLWEQASAKGSSPSIGITEKLNRETIRLLEGLRIYIESCKM